VRPILRFVFVVVPTAALATAVVIAVSRNGEGAAVTSDGDLQRDLQLASTTSLELAPAGQPLATISSIEAPPAATPKRTVRPRRATTGARALRSRAPVVRAAPEPEVADAVEAAAESAAPDATELAGVTETGVEGAVAGGVALPRPTAIPVNLPTGGADEPYDPGPGSVIRGGVLDDDHCQIHGRRRPIYGPPIFGQPGPRATLGDRLSGVRRSGDVSRGSIAGRVRAVQPGRSSGSSGSSGRGSIAGRIAAVRGR
jgi:hypothetical protein